jgi:hypothetical protein
MSIDPERVRATLLTLRAQTHALAVQIEQAISDLPAEPQAEEKRPRLRYLGDDQEEDDG